MLYIIVCGIVSLPADREHGPGSQVIRRDTEKEWRTIMAYNILFTSLFSVGKDEPLRYYYAQEGDKRLYTDAMLTVEATTEYILSQQHIDEILILGRHLPHDAGDDRRFLGVDEGKTFYASDINELSTYELFRYRIAQFIDELEIEQQDLMELLTPEEQKKAESFIKGFFNKVKAGNEHVKFSRFFDRIAQDPALYDSMRRELVKAIPEAEGNMGRYVRWLKNYLYMNLKETSKMETLEGNEEATVRFVPTEVDENGKLPVDTLLRIVNDVVSEHDEIDIYVALNNDDMTDNFVLLSLLDILDSMYSGRVDVKRVITITNAHYRMAGMIRDDSESYGISALVSAARAFLQYGKVDLIVDYWEKSRSKNPQVGKMIYAMRRIDTGLSLCSIGDIIKGIADLRELFRDGFDLSGSDYYSKLFGLLSEGIKMDYGRLVTADDAGFIDLVKWANSKGFYQQCLTMIEAKAPREMVEKGMFYYCDSEEDKQRVTDIFAHQRLEMKSMEHWKMEDMDHYFVKAHRRFKFPPTTIENQRANAEDMLTIIENTDPEQITGYTVCEDMQALEDLLFAYFHVGRIRNETNHAEERVEEADTLFPDEKDVSVKLIHIQESIMYFIQAFDKVTELVRDKDVSPVRITVKDVKAAARRIEKEYRDSKR